MAQRFRIKDGYLRIWISFLYLLCGLFGRFICSKSGPQLSVDGHIIRFDERHRGAYWRRVSLTAFRSRLDLRIFAVCTLPSPPIFLFLALHRWRFRVLDL